MTNLGPFNTDADIASDLIPFLINQMKTRYDVNARTIDMYNSAIYPFERRIAFRYELSGSDFHFMRETSDGRWAEKKGSNKSNSTVFSLGLTPEDNIWDAKYTSSTFYFAINNNGGNFDYAAF